MKDGEEVLVIGSGLFASVVTVRRCERRGLQRENRAKRGAGRWRHGYRKGANVSAITE